MAKRAARNKLRDRDYEESGTVQALFPSSVGWNPMRSR